MTMIDIWTVYEKPKDYPQQYVARLWKNAKPTTTIQVAKTLEELRIKLLDINPGLYRLDRAPNDDPVILETWL